MTIKAVIFDMDGTLLDTERVCLATFVATGKRYGLTDLTPTFMKIVGRSGTSEESVIAKALGTHVSFADFIAEWDKAMDAHLAQGVPVKDGALDLCQALAQKGLPMAVATSTSTARANTHLQHAGLAQFFQHIIGGDQVTRRKPDPEPYIKTAALLGVTPQECVMFEDSDPGTRAAFTSGGITVQIPDLKAPDPEVAALGHLIAPNLMAGARQIGLI